MGRPRKFKTVEELEKAWGEYKAYCDNKEVLTHKFSGKDSKFISKKLKQCITYTIEGFCVYARIARQDFYATYDNKNSEFCDMVTRMREECEVDARTKFEIGAIDPKLAGLWMSRHGYSIKTDNNVKEKRVIIVDDMDELED